MRVYVGLQMLAANIIKSMQTLIYQIKQKGE